ncbi:unnamed protein product [Timema podura]|uniref:Sulfhydryl oxidase n=1 Tax=Timema podura TaxID=61482 RepID=A0ABN7NUJ6_TIMPD|nr:unnamed protein product [Timema podura]
MLRTEPSFVVEDLTLYKPSKAPQEEIPEKRDDLQCPLDKDELGRKTWSFLHTMAAYYPEKPSLYQENDVKQFFSTFSRLLKVSPPATKSQEELSQWLCKIHNSVNERLGKSLFDCSRVNERWRDGWKDGSCDY